jgi:hypothetical protein
MAECRRMLERIFSSIVDYCNLKASGSLFTHECSFHGDVEACGAGGEAEELSRRALRDLMAELERFKSRCLVGE